ncbi:MAG: DNA polymerase II [Ignavibacterium sp.]|nr:DNA polymerase II [Ignavibacterium sp.]
MPDTTTNIFLLTGDWFDYQGRNILRFFGTSDELGSTDIIINNNKPVFFVERSAMLTGLKQNFLRKEVDMKTFSGSSVDALYFNTIKDLRQTADDLKEIGITTYESDVDPVRRFLMERFINAQMKVTGESKSKNGITTFSNPKTEPCEITPDFIVASIDIETSGNGSDLYSIAVQITGRKGNHKRIFMIGESPRKFPGYISFHITEKELFQSFFEWFNIIDPDIIIGWHVIGFDLLFLDNKCKELNINFDIGRNGGRVSIRRREPRGYFASLPGRVIIDGPTALRTSFFNFEDFKLETVAQELLGIGKTITPEENKVEEIERQFKEDKISLAEYNLQDAILVTDILNKTGIIDLYIKRAQLSGLLIDQLAMMTAAFDHFYLPKLHRYGYVAPDVKDLETTEHSAGGHVLDPIAGIYDDVAVLDFKSLYPSIIQTFKIDPLSRLLSEKDTIKTPEGFKFSATQHFLPEFIDQLMEQRSLAKKKNDKALSQAIKILMNSFYGVMGSYGCRFYHPDLPSAITSTGKHLLLGSKSFLEERGYKVVYGDTDSLFVMMIQEPDIDYHKAGDELARLLNLYWNEELKQKYEVESFLEIEFEKYYRKFIVTPARGSEAGAKKRYAGLLSKNGEEEIEFVGLEFVRSDWTRLAKEFQTELYNKIFNNEEVDDWIRSVVNKLKKGEFDEKLIYKKRLRKDVEEYVKNVPPHARAAKLLQDPGDTVYYVITQRGPIPIQLKHNDIDYDHYIEKQLKPIADSVLTLLSKSFDNIVQTDQLSFF